MREIYFTIFVPCEKRKHFNEKNLSLTEYFFALPKAERKPVIISAPKEDLVEEIASMYGKTKMTARRWLYRYVEPCLAEMQKITALFNSGQR